ncbi:MAG: AzlC family ABC transporter permease [Betaproteobacteria bacterium]|nr:AzlC family ABC transporter permease [Betaproteobacteria bacterium]
METPRSAYFAGIRAQAPGIVGVIPFGLITGAASTAIGMDPWLALGMSVIIFAGASQLVAFQLMAQNAPAFIVILTVLVVNLRMVMYSAAIAPFFRHLPPMRKWLFSYLMTDHSFALMTSRFAKSDPAQQANSDAFYFGATSIMWCVWQATVAIGIFAGTLVPAKWSLDFAIPLVFMSLVLPALQTRQHWAAAITASVAAAFTTAMPLKLGLISAALVGVVIGSWLDARVEAKGVA